MSVLSSGGSLARARYPPSCASPITLRTGDGACALWGVFRTTRSSCSISVSVNASSVAACDADRPIIVSQNMRQLRTQNTAIRLVSQSAVRSLDSSALQAELRILWKISIFQRMAYHSSFSIASARDLTGRSVISLHSMRARERRVALL